MVLTFQIDKLQPGAYRVAVLQGGVEVTAPEVYPTIEDAVREEVEAVPEGFAHFAEIRYGGASSGTVTLQGLPGQAGEIANRLVAIVAEMHRVGIA